MVVVAAAVVDAAVVPRIKTIKSKYFSVKLAVLVSIKKFLAQPLKHNRNYWVRTRSLHK